MRTSAKGNNARKILSYYSVNFDITPPYQVLCDGPTVFQAMKNDMYIKQSLPALLGATAYPVVTECIVRELRSLGEDYSNATLFAKRATRVPCAHQESLSANECIIARLKTPFDTKLILASNDIEVLTTVGKIPGIPLITIVNQTKFALKSPSRFTIEYVRGRETAKTKVLSKRDEFLLKQLHDEEAEAVAQRKPARKRKRSGEPNPLSVKKRRVVPEDGERFQKKTDAGNPEKPKKPSEISNVEASKAKKNNVPCETDSGTSGDVNPSETTMPHVTRELKKPKRKRRRKRMQKEANDDENLMVSIEVRDGPEKSGASCCVEGVASSSQDPLLEVVKVQQGRQLVSVAEVTDHAHPNENMEKSNRTDAKLKMNGSGNNVANPTLSIDGVTKMHERECDGQGVNTEADAIQAGPVLSNCRAQADLPEGILPDTKCDDMTGDGNGEESKNESGKRRESGTETTNIAEKSADLPSIAKDSSYEKKKASPAEVPKNKKQRKNRRRRTKKESTGEKFAQGN